MRGGGRGAPREEESPQRREDEGKTRGVSGRAASTKRYPLPSGPLPLLRGIPFHAWVPGTPSVSVVSLLSPLSLGSGPQENRAAWSRPRDPPGKASLRNASVHEAHTAAERVPHSLRRKPDGRIDGRVSARFPEHTRCYIFESDPEVIIHYYYSAFIR